MVLAAIGIVGASLRESEVESGVSLSVGSIVFVAAIGMAGPLGGAVVAGVSQLLEFNKLKSSVRLFNTAMAAAGGAVGGVVYLLIGGWTTISKTAGVGELLLWVGLPLVVADFALAVANAAFLGGVMRLTQGTSVASFVTRMLTSFGLSYIGYGVIGFLLVVLWGPGEVGVMSAVLILAPLFVARWVYTQYGDERRAHERAIGSMITATELNDVFTRGHAERVAALSNLIARELGLGHQRADALRYAALLHDVGMIGVRAGVLRQSTALGVDDLAEVQRHPQLGVEMLGQIGFLSESFDGIRHHHERFDGRGYPDGLSGQHIPEFARIIAVADAFDSMTTTRSYRPALSVAEALRTLRDRAGSQLDPDCVDALERALEGQSWEPNRIDDDTLARAGSAHDHDDPAVSDLMAQHADELRDRASRSRRAVSGGSRA
ncbi:MAG TPA: HD-GYP domain-containing protein [Segeticoccus sp.]|nr:HD-GYP domain-containing protein [Segeticoccus sp.]